MNIENNDIKLANKAIKKCLSHLKNSIPIKKKIIKKEVKLNLDQEFHNIIINILKKKGLPILSEENKKEENELLLKKNNDFWVIDPLDGSLNFLKGIEGSSICISLVKKRKISLSLIYDMHKKITYIAFKNKIYLNGEKKKFKREFLNKNNCILSTGFPNKYDFKSQLANYNQYLKVRMIGCASLSLIGCMTGKFDWYEEKNIMLWDIISGYHFNLINKCKIKKKINLKQISQTISLGYCI